MSELISGGTPAPSALWQDRQFSRYRSAPERRKSPSGPIPEDGWAEAFKGGGAQSPTRPMLDPTNGIPRCLSQLSPSTAVTRRPPTTCLGSSFRLAWAATAATARNGTPARGRQTPTQPATRRNFRQRNSRCDPPASELGSSARARRSLSLSMASAGDLEVGLRCPMH
jgi:hypothetical protein